jgi:hypothetical protein
VKKRHELCRGLVFVLQSVHFRNSSLNKIPYDLAICTSKAEYYLRFPATRHVPSILLAPCASTTTDGSELYAHERTSDTGALYCLSPISLLHIWWCTISFCVRRLSRLTGFLTYCTTRLEYQPKRSSHDQHVLSTIQQRSLRIALCICSVTDRLRYSVPEGAASVENDWCTIIRVPTTP